MPTTLVAQCPELKHIVFLGTGASSYMNVDELNARGIKATLYPRTRLVTHLDVDLAMMMATVDAFAASTQFHEGAHMSTNGPGAATIQPMRRSDRRPN